MTAVTGWLTSVPAEPAVMGSFLHCGGYVQLTSVLRSKSLHWVAGKAGRSKGDLYKIIYQEGDHPDTIITFLKRRPIQAMVLAYQWRVEEDGEA